MKSKIRYASKNGHKQLMVNLILFTILKDKLKIEIRNRKTYVNKGGWYKYTNIYLSINELNILAEFLRENGDFELYAARYNEEINDIYDEYNDIHIPANNYNCFRIVTKAKHDKCSKGYMIHIKGDFEYIAFIHVNKRFKEVTKQMFLYT